MFNFKIVSIISCESDVGKDAYRAYRVDVRPLHVEQEAPSTQEVIILCEDIFRYKVFDHEVSSPQGIMIS